MKNNVFDMPKAVTINGRTSSITNSFYNGIVPVVQPTDAQVKEALEVLGQSEDDVRCVYCGDRKTEWDHLHPLIVNKKHTGYITEIANLVPACSKCNQSKGNSDWKEWMLSGAEKSPRTRGIVDIADRIRTIENYDRHFEKKIINIEEEVRPELWQEYVNAYDLIISNMEKAQKLMDQIKAELNPQKKNYRNFSKTVNFQAEIHSNGRGENKMENNSVKAVTTEYLNKVGKTMFVKYYPMFISGKYSNSEISRTMQENEGFTQNSCNSRTAKSRKIIQEGLAETALQIVTEANVDEQTRNLAEKFLEAGLF